MLSKKLLSPLLALSLLVPTLGYANFFTQGVKYGACVGALIASIEITLPNLAKDASQNLKFTDKLLLSTFIASAGAIKGAIGGGIIGFALDRLYPVESTQQK